MTGTLMLSGGQEHGFPSMSIDRALLASLGASAPRVAVVPAASSPRKRPAAALGARLYWSQLGVAVDVIAVDPVPDAAHAHPPAALREADLIVLTGGHPARLAAATATTLWPHILERWRQGVALSGSSAGAMVLCEWRQQLTPPRPLRFIRGFGLVPGCAAAPHFNRPVVRRCALTASRARPDITMLGLDEQTAVMARDGQYTVHGAGAATIVRAGVTRRYEAGSLLPIGPATSRPTAQIPGRRSATRLVEPGSTKFPYPWAPAGSVSDQAAPPRLVSNR